MGARAHDLKCPSASPPGDHRSHRASHGWGLWNPSRKGDDVPPKAAHSPLPRVTRRTQGPLAASGQDRERSRGSLGGWGQGADTLSSKAPGASLPPRPRNLPAGLFLTAASLREGPGGEGGEWGGRGQRKAQRPSPVLSEPGATRHPAQTQPEEPPGPRGTPEWPDSTPEPGADRTAAGAGQEPGTGRVGHPGCVPLKTGPPGPGPGPPLGPLPHHTAISLSPTLADPQKHLQGPRTGHPGARLPGS